MIELQGCDKGVGFLPAGHCARVDAPEADDLVGAATRDAIVLLNVENGTCDDVLVGEHLNRASLVQIPDYHLHIRTCRQEVILVRLLGTPVDVENVENVAIFELFERFDLLMRAISIEQSRRLTLVIVDRKGLIDAQDAVHASSRQILAVLAEFDHPDGQLAHGELMQVVQIAQLRILLLDNLGLDLVDLVGLLRGEARLA